MKDSLSTKVEIAQVLLRSDSGGDNLIYKSRNCTGLIAPMGWIGLWIIYKSRNCTGLIAMLGWDVTYDIYKSRNCTGLIASQRRRWKPRSTKVEIAQVLLRAIMAWISQRRYKFRKTRNDFLAYPYKTRIFRSGFCLFPKKIGKLGVRRAIRSLSTSTFTVMNCQGSLFFLSNSQTKNHAMTITSSSSRFA